MAFNIYGEPIPDLASTSPPAELPQRADGQPCNIFGEIIDDAQAVAEKNHQLPPASKGVRVVQGAVVSTFSMVGALAVMAAKASIHTDQEAALGYEDELQDGYMNGNEGYGYYMAGIKIDDD
ncbi:MAG: hypothetical protein QNL70_00250 [Pseudomonas sp.]